MLVHILSVEKVSLGFGETKSSEPTICVVATGTVNTAGWTNIELLARRHGDKPQDGIVDFDFVGEKPKGFVSKVILPVSAPPAMDVMPKWLKGVRVHSATNNIVAMVEDKACRVEMCDASLLKEEGYPWPW